MGTRTSLTRKLRSAKKSYRRRVSRSMCKKMATKKKCRRMRGCSWYRKSSKGKGYCRKQHNKKRMGKSMRKRMSKRRPKSRRMRGGSKHTWEHASQPASY